MIRILAVTISHVINFLIIFKLENKNGFSKIYSRSGES